MAALHSGTAKYVIREWSDSQKVTWYIITCYTCRDWLSDTQYVDDLPAFILGAGGHKCVGGGLK